ncbi:MAG: Hint domain-containing protein, partial [Pseudomonadota bacterium]
MPDGYLVQLGDGSLDAGDGIVDPLFTFETETVLGSGTWIWSGTWNGITFTNESEPGDYVLSTDGNIYFVPDFGPVATITAASVTAADAFLDGTTSDETLTGSGVDDTINGREGDDDIFGQGGEDYILGGAGDDDIFGGGNSDYINAGDDNDEVSGGGGSDEVLGGEGEDTLDGDGGADTLSGGSGNDTIDGGSGDDVLYGDQSAGRVPESENLSWDKQGDDGDDVTAGFTQNTGLLNVAVSITNDGALSAAEIDTTTDQYTEAGEPFDDESSLEVAGNGGADTTTIRIDFTATDDADVEDAAQNILFRLNDIDTGTWTDVITVNAFDENGNSVQVDLTPEGTNFTQTGNTITSGETNGSATTSTGSILVEITGPVAYFEIIYENGSTGAQRMWLTDVHFETVLPEDGDDTLTGGLGADDMFGGGGADTFNLADGDEAYGEDGDDIFILGDLGETASTILIDGGEGEETAGDTIQLNGQAALSDVVFNVGNPESGTITLTDGTVVNFSNIENIICFTPGTLIATPFGTRRIETLVKGDLVLTRDNGPQPLRWIGSRAVLGTGDFAPIELSPSAFPEANAPLLVSPQHRMLFTGYRAELLFGESEVLVAAKHLLGGAAVRIRPQRKVTYIHIMFDRHEIITANGALTESFFAADQSLSALNDPARDE